MTEKLEVLKEGSEGVSTRRGVASRRESVRNNLMDKTSAGSDLILHSSAPSQSQRAADQQGTLELSGRRL
jgi:hypothetical protein